MNQRILFHLAWDDRMQPNVNRARCMDQNLRYNNMEYVKKFHKRKGDDQKDKHLRNEHQNSLKV